MRNRNDAEPERPSVEVVDLRRLAQAADRRLAWTGGSEDLHLNLVILDAGAAVEEHVNAEVDVLLVGIEGNGVVAIEGDRQALGPGHAVVIPKGRRRSIAGGGARFAYLTCHRRRGGLWPVPRS